MAAYTDLWHRFKASSALWKIIIVNITLFLTLRLLGIIFMIGGGDINNVVDNLALPSRLDTLARQPWTVVSYMFTHYAPFHILFNMLTLYWFGKMMLWRCSSRQMVWLYVYGGIAGAMFYLVAAQIFIGVGGWLLGASAAVIAIVIATAIMMPDFSIVLLFFGSVKLKWIAVAAVVLFALGLVGDNAGGHVAHFGGIAMGCLFGLLYNRGIDITRPMCRLTDRVTSIFKNGGKRNAPKQGFKFKKKPHTVNSNSSGHQSEADDRRNLDEILDKIKHSGYTALTPDERRRLFEISRRVK